MEEGEDVITMFPFPVESGGTDTDNASEGANGYAGVTVGAEGGVEEEDGDTPPPPILNSL